MRDSILPSLISLPQITIMDRVREIEQQRLSEIHVDILDGHFSPSMPLGFQLLKDLREETSIGFDCHVMVNGTTKYYVDELLALNPTQVLFHIETEEHVDWMLNYIHGAGVKTGVALKPSTPLSTLDYVLEKCDTVLLMLMNPGFASSKSEVQVPYAFRKIRDLKQMVLDRNLSTQIELDGRVSRENIIMCVKEGIADRFVCGSTCLDVNNIGGSIEDIVYELQAANL